ncbi:aldehyde dehydrogenase family protein [Conexibacter arvalis]|uniref:aldehyde dehydrogenase family protein n=1 Tax=Conexibacter arvalis TaxID=912552 RepID=UPI00160B1165
MTASARDWPLFVAGAWEEAGPRERIEVENPATGETVATVPVATAADLDRALAAAEAARSTWARTDAWTRSALVRAAGAALARRAEEVAATIVREQGKPLAEARAEVGYAVETFDWYADEARRLYGRTVPGHRGDARLTVLREPVGPVAAFTPWNFPAVTPARKVAAALAAGCPVILKPSEETPGAAFHLAEACEEAGLPLGLLSVVCGVPAEISGRLLASPTIRKVSLTGSVPVGRTLMAQCAEHLQVPTLELGGHAAVLVFADADLDAAVERCVTAKFRNAGQVCLAPSRFYVERAIAEPFARRFAERAAALTVGDGFDPATEVGPLASARRLEATERLVADAVGRGAELLCGGRRPPGRERGWFYEPTVLTGVDPASALMVEEPFAPIAPLLGFDGLEEGLRLANATPYGLAHYAFTRDLRTAQLALEGLEAGVVGINTCLTSTVEAPLSGVKQSGIGAENGVEGIEAYTVVKYGQVQL